MLPDTEMRKAALVWGWMFIGLGCAGLVWVTRPHYYLMPFPNDPALQPTLDLHERIQMMLQFETLPVIVLSVAVIVAGIVVLRLRRRLPVPVEPEAG